MFESGDDMRLGSLTVSATLSAVLLSGCSFIGGQPSGYKNPFAKQKSANQGHYGHQKYGQPSAGQHCQIATPRQPIPRGCRPEQVTIGTGGNYGRQQNYGAQGGFPQQPQFGQPQYTDGGYGSAVGQTAALAHHTGPKKRKPRLRGSLSLGVEKSNSGALFTPDVVGIPDYNPQDFNVVSTTGSEASGNVTTTTFTANERINAGDLNQTSVRVPGYDPISAPTISFDDVWSTPASLKAGLEYIINDNTTVFASGGYTYAEGNEGDVANVNATVYRETVSQDYTPRLDASGNPIPGAYMEDGTPTVDYAFQPNRQIASFSYDFSDLEQYDLEVGARRYLNPIIKSEGFRTVTPFVGASVGVSHVNAVEYKQASSQTSYSAAFAGATNGLSFAVQGPTQVRRLYDAQWLPQGQLNLGAEWQLTPGFALAAETGVRVQGARDFADFTTAAGDFVEGSKGDVNISVPVTLRGSINF